MLLHRSSNVFENSTNILNSTTTWYQQYDHVSLNCQLVLHIKVFGDIVERKDYRRIGIRYSNLIAYLV